MFHLRLRIIAGILVTLAIGFTTLMTALSLPATGVRFAASEGTLIATVDDARHVVTAFEWGETTLPARPEFAIEEPDVIPDWDAYDALMADLGDLARASEASALRVRFADGTEQTLNGQDRGFSELPGTFWLQWACALVAMVLSVLVWSPRPKELPAALFALTGTGHTISALAASVYSTRELMIDGALFRALNVVNEWGAILFASTLTNLLWCYPLRLAPRGLLPGAWIAGAIAMALTAFRPFETPPLNHHLWMVLIFAVGIVGSVLQWSRTRQLAPARTSPCDPALVPPFHLRRHGRVHGPVPAAVGDRRRDPAAPGLPPRDLPAHVPEDGARRTSLSPLRTRTLVVLHLGLGPWRYRRSPGRPVPAHAADNRADHIARDLGRSRRLGLLPRTAVVLASLRRAGTR